MSRGEGRKAGNGWYGGIRLSLHWRILTPANERQPHFLFNMSEKTEFLEFE